MSAKKYSFITTEANRNQRLDQVLVEWLPQVLAQPLSKGKVRKLIVAGAIYLNGKRVRIASKNILPRSKIDAFIDLLKLNSSEKDQDIHFEMTQESVLYEDEDLIAVNKPPGLPTQPTIDEARNNLFLSVKKFLAHRQNIPVTQVYLGLHHRLDRDTSGVILFTKTQRANPGIAEIFKSHLAQKTYQALALKREGIHSIPKEWVVKNFLGKGQKNGKKAKYCSVRSGGDFAETQFKLIQNINRVVWVEAQPKTGRTHQIRVHLSEGGMPILGDVLYGGKLEVQGVNIQRLMLHAACLTFPHPIHHNRISIECSLPGDFKQCLGDLQKSGRDF